MLLPNLTVDVLIDAKPSAGEKPFAAPGPSGTNPTDKKASSRDALGQERVTIEYIHCSNLKA
jgi:hypothetical protein